MLFGALVGSHNFGSSGQHCPECGEDEFSKPMKDRADLVGDVNLTPREIEVIRFVALGYNQEELGTELSISPRTVEKHVKHGMEKLCARKRPHLVALALARGVIEPVQIVPAQRTNDGPLACNERRAGFGGLLDRKGVV